MIVKLEGGEDHSINPFRDHGLWKTGVYVFDAWDHNRDGRIDLKISPSEEASDQEVFLNAFWCFPENTKVSEKDILINNLPEQIVIFNDCSSLPNGVSIIRDDVILVTLANSSDEEKLLEPEIILKSILDVELNIPGNEISIGQNMLTSTLDMTDSRQIVPNKWMIKLTPLSVKPREEISFAVIYHGGSKITSRPYQTEEILEKREEAKKYWQYSSEIPYDKILVPDKNIQALVESSMRNIWQAREIRRGLPVFQVGTTCYRNLWIVFFILFLCLIRI